MVMENEGLIRVILAVIIGTLAAIIYSLRVLILMERRVARLEGHIESLVEQLLKSNKRKKAKR